MNEQEELDWIVSVEEEEAEAAVLSAATERATTGDNLQQQVNSPPSRLM
jgi:hypothetical protein